MRDTERVPQDVGPLRVKACTIVTRSYIPRARVVASSFLKWHPGREFSVLVIDDPERGFDPNGELFDIIRPDALDIEQSEYALLAGMYDVVGLASALKPKLLGYLLAKGDDAVLFLDSDR